MKNDWAPARRSSPSIGSSTLVTVGRGVPKLAYSCGRRRGFRMMLRLSSLFLKKGLRASSASSGKRLGVPRRLSTRAVEDEFSRAINRRMVLSSSIGRRVLVAGEETAGGRNPADVGRFA